MKIIPLEENYIPEIILLSNNVFGKGFLTKDYIRKYIKRTDSIGYISTLNNNFTGYILINTYPLGKFFDEILKRKEWFLENLNGYNSISFIKQIAVLNEYQKQGIASDLINHALIESNKLSEITCCLAWKKNNEVALRKALIKNGFEYKVIINNYWSKDSIKKDYSCSSCGVPPCRCSTEVYIKKNASVKN